ncbi:ABC transporter substrate-binding protein [Variovorax sp. PBL-E5]|uniref:ABC transporter substrate-binding protein n=1 Tax=Variovorax sp. PBL-E5 TaxID=434014 RepID=UPI001316866C|nr:ABC transporter substrate-binding protein [Variovorax sp. PBL-E5]VTU24088.1 Leucine-, isoleucine-, valine-, threonine-, and alanine-binding protein precursor [Variovorax sp. PBL-E5]
MIHSLLRHSLKLVLACAVAGPLVPAMAQDTYKIGSVLSMTGPAAFLGEDMKAGMELALDEINAKGGVNGKKLEWFFYDAESQTQKGLTATRRLLTQDKVEMIVGGGNMSGMAIAMLQQTEKAAVPFISTEGSMQIVTPVAERAWTFKSTVDDDQVMERLADYFAKKSIKKIGMLADSSGFGQSAVEQLKKTAAARGLDVAYESFNPTDTDMTPQLSALKAAGVQAILCWTVTPAGVVAMKQAKTLGLGDIPFVHSYGFVDKRYMDLAGDAAKGVLLVSVKFPVGEDLPDSDPAKPRILALNKNFEARFKRRPNQFAAQTYDAIYLAKTALEKGGTDKEKVRDALGAIRNYNGVGGTFNFSPTQHSGLSKADLVLLKYEGGRFRLADYQ